MLTYAFYDKIFSDRNNVTARL